MKNKVILISFCLALIFILIDRLSAQSNATKLWYEEVDAIVLLDDSEFEITSKNNAIYKVHRMIQVFNERGKKYDRVLLHENKFVTCSKISGRILDPSGKVIKKLNKNEIRKATISPGYILYNDTKYQWFELGLPNFPYILDYSYELEIKSLFFFLDWRPQQDIPVLKASYKLVLKAPITYRTHYIGFEQQPEEFEEKGNLIKVWRLENIEPKIDEDFMPPEHKVQLALLFAPAEFELEATTGSFASWDAFAEWYRQLTWGRYALSPAARQQVDSLIAGAMTSREKIQRLYSFLQNHTRYVAIELGLSSWQPQSAQSVYDNRYGDCKDLTTLMVAMLDVAGIKAYPASILTRDEGLLIQEFPSNQFNHCFAFVPLPSDTIWLECTADYLVAGELPPSDEGCDVLVIKENAGEIVRTPISQSHENGWTSKIVGRLSSRGSLFFEGTIRATGNIGFSLRSGFNDLKPEDRQRAVGEIIGKFVPKVDLLDYQIIHLSDQFDQPLIINFKATCDKFGAISANRIFLNPSILNRQTAADIPGEDERHFPVSLTYSYQEIDSLLIELPEGFEIEAAPDSLTKQSPFCFYKTSYSVEGQMLRYTRIFEAISSQIPVSGYNDYRSFLTAVVKNDNAKLVLRKVGG